tara:strand:- start:805 stop:1044 length:240 start_codon:yes stop_codon:yes gene_type:complete
MNNENKFDSKISEDELRVITRSKMNHIISVMHKQLESEHCVDGRAISIAITKMQEAGMWFTSSFFSESDRETFSEKVGG